MIKLPPPILATAILLLAPALPALPPAGPPLRIPEVHTSNFTGTPLDLPAMLEGKVAVLVLGFSKGARSQATLWGRRLATDYIYASDVLYYELPMLQSVPRPLRPLILRSIKSEVSPQSQPHFAALTADEPRWRSLVHYSNPDDAYVLLVDGKGFIKAQFQGDPSDSTYQELKRRVERLRAAPSE